MQEERLRLRALRVGALPILNRFIERLGLEEELTLALKNPGYAEALLALIKNILVDRNALYAVGEWVALYDVGLVARAKIGDDKLGRALERLFAADRATLQTRIMLAAIKGFDLKMDQIHNDTTSVTVSGAYDGQNAKAVQLKRGHNKERRPDLKQLVYSLCITADGAACTLRPTTATRPTMGSIWRRGTGYAPCCSIRASSTSPTVSCAQRRTCEQSMANVDSLSPSFPGPVPKWGCSQMPSWPAMCAGRRSYASGRPGMKKPSM